MTSGQQIRPMHPLFLLSVWRSGSSLLHALLNQHSQIALLYEGELPQLQSLLWAHLRDGSWHERWEFYNQGPSRHGLKVELPPEVRDVWQATRIVYQEFCRRKQAVIWGEKSPHWFDNALEIARRFPDARFIFLWRNLNEVLQSIRRAALSERFFRKPGYITRVLLGTEKLRHTCDALRAQGRSVHELDYQELISHPVESMQQICSFLELPFEPQMASLVGADRSATFPGEHHSLVRADRIFPVKKETEVLPLAVRQKVARYVCRWQQAQSRRWPLLPSNELDGVHPPSRFESLRDRIIFRALLTRDLGVKLIYGAVPLSFARLLRSCLRQRVHAKKFLEVSQ